MTFEDLTEEQKESLKGEKGDKGDIGEQGPQGPKGDTGAKGEDGFSPIVKDTEGDGYHTITITDAEGYTIVKIKDGQDGQQGERGEKGERGERGAAGVYLGSDTPTDEEITVWIDPQGELSSVVTEDRVKELIASALEEVENGSY
jgi:hypothetical protein